MAHVDLEWLTLDRNVRVLRDQFVTIELGRALYNGRFFIPEREFSTSAIPASQRTVNGVVWLKLIKGNMIVEGRYSDEVRPVLSCRTARGLSPPLAPYMGDVFEPCIRCVSHLRFYVP